MRFLCHRINLRVFRYFTRMEPLSDLSFIEIKDRTNPAPLFNEWVEEAKKFNSPLFVMSLATVDRHGGVSNRNVVVAEVLPDISLAFMTQIRSNKVKDINGNPNVAASILFNYNNNNGIKILRQINVKGEAVELPHEKSKEYFQKYSTSAKIRSWIAQDCGPVDWKDQKTEHDQLLKEVENGKVLEMPDSLVAYKVVASAVDFYYSIGNKIGDRVLFTKDQHGAWKSRRLMP